MQCVCVCVCVCVFVKCIFQLIFEAIFCLFNIPRDINSAIDEVSTPVVPKVCSADPKGSATSPQGIRGYISAMVTFVWSLDYII
jgi:hypothetical protein